MTPVEVLLTVRKSANTETYHKICAFPLPRGVVLKKKWGDAWNRTSTTIFLNNLGLHTRQKKCHSGSLVLSCDTATRVWVSVADWCFRSHVFVYLVGFQDFSGGPCSLMNNRRYVRHEKHAPCVTNNDVHVAKAALTLGCAWRNNMGAV